MRRKTLSDKGVAELEAREDGRWIFPDPELRGHWIRVSTSGAKTYVAVTRDPFGKQVWVTIGRAELYTIEEAREKARAALKAIKDGAIRTGPQCVASVAEEWYKRHVLGRKLRSHAELRRYLDKHILPEWGGRDFESIGRGEITKLLDKIEDNSGAVAADKCLAVISNLCNWFETRNDNYRSPIVRGMSRSNPRERARERILNDEELRAVWTACEGTFGAFVRMLLLTAQRREKVVSMRWEDVSLDGTWSIPAEAREKTTAGALVLPALALDIIKDQPRLADNPYVFAGQGDSYFKGVSKYKKAFEAKVPIEPWTLHDLRRTARSFMARAGVSFDVAERCLGHTIRGVAGIYDRHSYHDEKADALQRLAGLVEKILTPPADNVVQLVPAAT